MRTRPSKIVCAVNDADTRALFDHDRNERRLPQTMSYLVGIALNSGIRGGVAGRIDHGRVVSAVYSVIGEHIIEGTQFGECASW